MRRETKSLGLFKKIALTGLMMSISLILTLLAGEVFLRIVYRDAGTTTMKGPGGKSFVHTYSTRDPIRGPRIKEPKKRGIERILIIGDSITFGWGIHDWRDIYTHRLLKLLNTGGEKFDIFTDANSGREMDHHLKALKNVIEKVDPDTIIYQWYINDLEIIKARKRSVNQNLFWRAFPYHKNLIKLSYLYFFLDSRLAIFIPSSDIRYEDIMLRRFDEKGREWARFRILFHDWATIATSRAERTILMLYPHPPVSVNSPLKILYERMKKISGPHILYFPGYTTLRDVGRNLDDSDSYYGKVRKVLANENKSGYLAKWQNLYLKGGSYQMTFRLKASNTIDKPIALIEIKSYGKVIERLNISGSDFNKPDKWQAFTIPFNIIDTLDISVEFEVQYLGGADLSLSRIELPIDYGIEVIDLTPNLTGFNSYVSLFDAHPNEQAHEVMAQELYKQIIGE